MGEPSNTWDSVRQSIVDKFGFQFIFKMRISQSEFKMKDTIQVIYLMKSSIVLSLVAYVEANLRIATLSDLHLFEEYEPRFDSTGACWPNSNAPLLEKPAFFG